MVPVGQVRLAVRPHHQRLHVGRLVADRLGAGEGGEVAEAGRGRIPGAGLALAVGLAGVVELLDRVRGVAPELVVDLVAADGRLRGAQIGQRDEDVLPCSGRQIGRDRRRRGHRRAHGGKLSRAARHLPELVREVLAHRQPGQAERLGLAGHGGLPRARDQPVGGGPAGAVVGQRHVHGDVVRGERGTGHRDDVAARTARGGVAVVEFRLGADPVAIDAIGGDGRGRAHDPATGGRRGAGAGFIDEQRHLTLLAAYEQAADRAAAQRQREGAGIARLVGIGRQLARLATGAVGAIAQPGADAHAAIRADIELARAGGIAGLAQVAVGAGDVGQLRATVAGRDIALQQGAVAGLDVGHLAQRAGEHAVVEREAEGDGGGGGSQCCRHVGAAGGEAGHAVGAGFQHVLAHQRPGQAEAGIEEAQGELAGGGFVEFDGHRVTKADRADIQRSARQRLHRRRLRGAAISAVATIAAIRGAAVVIVAAAGAQRQRGRDQHGKGCLPGPLSHDFPCSLLLSISAEGGT
ncbi:hypothetical protein D3C87_1176490 [compost metagenome]